MSRSDLEVLARQERELTFPSFDEERAFRIAVRLREFGLAGRLPIAIDVTFAGAPLVYLALPGASPDNADWIRRKRNVVLRTHRSSYAVGLDFAEKGTTFSEKTGAPLVDFAAHGGSFPVRLTGSTLVVGAVTVSGLPQRADHELVVRVLAEELGKKPNDYALG